MSLCDTVLPHAVPRVSTVQPDELRETTFSQLIMAYCSHCSVTHSCVFTHLFLHLMNTLNFTSHVYVGEIIIWCQTCSRVLGCVFCVLREVCCACGLQSVSGNGLISKDLRKLEVKWQMHLVHSNFRGAGEGIVIFSDFSAETVGQKKWVSSRVEQLSSGKRDKCGLVPQCPKVPPATMLDWKNKYISSKNHCKTNTLFNRG